MTIIDSNIDKIVTLAYINKTLIKEYGMKIIHLLITLALATSAHANIRDIAIGIDKESSRIEKSASDDMKRKQKDLDEQQAEIDLGQECIKDPSKNGCDEYKKDFCRKLKKANAFRVFVRELNSQSNCSTLFDEITEHSASAKKSLDTCNIKATDVCKSNNLGCDDLDEDYPDGGCENDVVW